MYVATLTLTLTLTQRTCMSMSMIRLLVSRVSRLCFWLLMNENMLKVRPRLMSGSD